MRSTDFVDKEVNEELEKIFKNKKSEKSKFPEHDFLLSCLKMKLTLNDLKFLSYVDVLKIFISAISDNNSNSAEKIRNATQKDIDKLLGG